MIDVSKFKTCWFGESERNLKKLFDKYRKKVDKSDIAPILLFNEADAIFGKRKDVNSSNVAQTENAIQNIILQEMETLDGILIATTNLTENFDKAFERRFLYKICFEKPETEVALQIWKIRFPEMEDSLLKFLIEKYSFTGGQIENIARKYKMSLILNGIIPDFNQMEQYCKEEVLPSQTRKTLGFCINS
jgi:SpoVK/Ycf46/Vps4 family AAA+-type ATPase